MQYATNMIKTDPAPALPMLNFEVEAESDSSIIRNDSWMVSFIDILTLLLTLFVLLVAYKDNSPLESNAPQPAVQQTVTESLVTEPLTTEALTSEPLTSEPEITQLQMSETLVSEALMLAASSFEPSTLEPETTSQQPETVSEEEPATAPASVDIFLHTFGKSGLDNQLEVRKQAGVVNIEASDSILFKPARAELTPEGIALLKELAIILVEHPYTLSVEGHTDNIPIDTARFPSNWELSAARATIVTRSLIEQGIKPGQIRTIGYGDTRPLADNHSAEGRAKNRRVSFVLQFPVPE